MTKKDIQLLIERFMAGLSTIEEENRLAEYFRTHDVPDEWNDYKEMFAWFDNGMPLKSRQADGQTSGQAASGLGSSSPAPSSPSKKRILLFFAAAVVAMLLIMVWPKKKMPETAGRPALQTATISDTKATVTDSLHADTTMTSKPKKEQRRPSRIRRDTYRMMPPKTYTADTLQDTIIEIQILLAEKQLDDLLQQQEDSLKKMEERYSRMGLAIDIYNIALEYYDEEEENYQ